MNAPPMSSSIDSDYDKWKKQDRPKLFLTTPLAPHPEVRKTPPPAVKKEDMMKSDAEIQAEEDEIIRKY